MDTHSLRLSLSSMWPIVFSATQRPLTDDEMNELRRLAELVRRGVPGRDAFNRSAQALCDSLHSSGVFEATNDPGLLDLLLHRIDELRTKLE